MKLNPIVAALATLALGTPLTAAAAIINTVQFDYTGGGSGVTTSSFDFNPGNALAVNSVPLTVGSTFTTYVQMEVSDLLGSGYGGGSMALPIGADGPYEFTTTVQLNERVQNAIDTNGDLIPDIVVFEHLGGTFNIYYDPLTGGTINADGLTGNTGFGYADGSLILSGTIEAQLNGASYLLEVPLDIVNLDNYDTNDLLGILSVTGTGNTSMDVVVTSFDSNFFVDPPTVLTVAFNGTLETPFDSNNPEISVMGNAPNYGPDGVNGVFGGGATAPEDFQFEVDGNASFTAQVPEPATLALLGLGLVGLGLSRRRRS